MSDDLELRAWAFERWAREFVKHNEIKSRDWWLLYIRISGQVAVKMDRIHKTKNHVSIHWPNLVRSAVAKAAEHERIVNYFIPNREGGKDAASM
jgi:hypothetical protein